MQINVFAFEKDLRLQTWPQQKEKKKNTIATAYSFLSSFIFVSDLSQAVVVENAMFVVKFILQKAL